MKKPVFYTEIAHVLALVLLALGTALTAYGDLGISMVVAPAYILHLKLSQVFPFFTFGVAGYPEKHEEAMNIESDIAYLKSKVEAGAKYVVTQMFFDNSRYFSFVERCREAGITVPIIPGIKPLTSLTQQSLLPKTFHIDLPEDLAREFRRCKSNDDVKALGVEWGIAQAREVKAANVASIHFYSMNAAASIEAIAKAVY